MTAQVVAITADELDALHGAGPLSFQVYVLLRAWMDYGTGAVGFSRPISLHMLRAYCESHTPRGTGVQIEQPSEKGIRTALDRLQRAGLLRRTGGDRLAFLLPLALTASARPQQTRQGDGAELSTEPGMAKASPGTGFTAEPGTGNTPAEGPNPAHIMNHVLLSSTCGLAEYLRGQDVQTAGKEHVIAGWRSSGVTLDQLGKAVAMARAIRTKAGSRQALNVGFIESILNAAPPAPAAPAAPAAPTASTARALTHQALLRIGAERDRPPRPGESWEAYRLRLLERAR